MLYDIYYFCGSNVDSVLDKQGLSLFFSNLDNSAKNSQYIEAALGSAFVKTADMLIGIGGLGAGSVLLGVVIAGFLIFLISKPIIRHNKLRQAEIIEKCRAYDEILYDDMPEEIKAPEHMSGDAVEQAKIRDDIEKKKGKKEDVIWGKTISLSDAAKDINEDREKEENAQPDEIAAALANPFEAIKKEIDRLSNEADKNTEETEITTIAEKAEEPEKTEKQDIHTDIGEGSIPSVEWGTVDWGFSLGESIDLFADDKEKKKADNK